MELYLRLGFLSGVCLCGWVLFLVVPYVLVVVGAYFFYLLIGGGGCGCEIGYTFYVGLLFCGLVTG